MTALGSKVSFKVKSIPSHLTPLSEQFELEGRDLTAGLIESRTQETFSNRTASEVATILAQRHGLAPVVVPTTTPIGRYYESEHDRVTLSQFTRASTEWDLLVLLARQEGYDIFVEGTSLFFQPTLVDAAGAVILDTAGLVTLQMRRSLTLARDLEVTVRSWSSRNQSTCVQTVLASMNDATASPASSETAQRYVFVRPNLTPDQALQYAQRRVAELIAHERIIEATMPGELSLTARSAVALTGTGTDFDQTYYVDTIERHFDSGNGFTQRIRCKNTSPRTLSASSPEPVNGLTGS